MADPFADLDAAQSQSTQTAATGPDPFADLDAPPGSTMTSLAASPFVGFNSALKSIAAVPGDIAGYGMAKLTGDESYRGAGTRAASREFGALGVDPDTHQPRSYLEKIGQSAGAAAGATLLPEAALAGVGRAGLAAALPRTTEALQGAFGSAASIPAVATNAVAGAASGAGAQVAEDLVPDRYKGTAALIGGLAGGVGTGAAIHGAGAVADYGLGQARAIAEPIIGRTRALTDADGNVLRRDDGSAIAATSGQADIAARRLAAGTSDVPAALDILETQPHEILPGSKGTTYQVTGDNGIGAQEKTTANLDNANAAAFATRRGQQNEARVAAIDGIEQNGNVTDVPAFLDARMRQIDDRLGAQEQAASQDASGKAAALGGTDAPEVTGNATRQTILANQADVKAQEAGLWKAVNPDGTLSLDASDIAKGADDIAKGVGKNARPPSGEEAAILSAAKATDGVQLFNDVTDLRSRISAEMRQQNGPNGDPAALRRLTMLRGVVENSIKDAANAKVAQDAHAVDAGLITPEETSIARLNDHVGAYQDQSDSALPSVRAEGAGAAGSGQAFNPGIRGTARSEGRGSAAASSDTGVPPAQPAITPNWDDAASGRLDAASQFTKQKHATFGNSTIKPVLTSRGNAGDFAMLDAAVPRAIFKEGPAGYQVAQAYLKTAGSQPEALTHLHDAAALSLRKAAQTKDGTIDPAKFDAWRKANADALRAIPSVAAKFSDAAAAKQTLSSIAASRKAAMDRFKAGAVGDLIGAKDETAVNRTIGGIFGKRDAVSQFKRLATMAKGDPNATAGLRQAVVDHMTDKFISNAEVAASGTDAIKPSMFQDFIRRNEASLAQVLSPAEIKNLKLVAADLKRANRSVIGVKNPGGSDTAQNLGRRGHDDHDGSLGGSLWKAAVVAGEVASPLAKTAVFGATIGKALLNSMSEAGLKTVSDVYREALLNPEVAHALLSRASKVPDHGSQRSLAHTLNRVSTLSALNAVRQ